MVILKNLKTSTLARKRTRSRKRTKNRGEKSTMQRIGIIKLEACGKVDLYYGSEPSTGGDLLGFLLKAILYGRVCNALIIFITPH